MSNVVPLARPTGDNIPAALRAIADDIEAGDYSFTPSMAVLVFADEESTASEGSLSVSLHGLGVRCHSQLVVLGLLQSAIGNMQGGEE